MIQEALQTVPKYMSRLFVKLRKKVYNERYLRSYISVVLQNQKLEHGFNSRIRFTLYHMDRASNVWVYFVQSIVNEGKLHC